MIFIYTTSELTRVFFLIEKNIFMQFQEVHWSSRVHDNWLIYEANTYKKGKYTYKVYTYIILIYIYLYVYWFMYPIYIYSQSH